MASNILRGGRIDSAHDADGYSFRSPRARMSTGFPMVPLPSPSASSPVDDEAAFETSSTDGRADGDATVQQTGGDQTRRNNDDGHERNGIELGSCQYLERRMIARSTQMVSQHLSPGVEDGIPAGRRMHVERGCANGPMRAVRSGTDNGTEGGEDTERHDDALPGLVPSTREQIADEERKRTFEALQADAARRAVVAEGEKRRAFRAREAQLKREHELTCKRLELAAADSARKERRQAQLAAVKRGREERRQAHLERLQLMAYEAKEKDDALQARVMGRLKLAALFGDLVKELGNA